MKLMQKESTLFKVLHMCVLNAMLSQILLPSAQAFAATSGPASHTAPTPFLLNAETPEGTHAALPAAAGMRLLKAAAASPASPGGGQQESSGFSLGSTDGMVDKFTGDFSYTIPLASIEGYPLVLSYNSNISMNTEASWVGLGWDLSVGAVSREMRGLPDEFNGEQQIIRTYNQAADAGDGKKNGGYVAVGASLFGGVFTPKVQLTALWGKYDNTYLGRGKTFDFGLQAVASVGTSEGLYIAPTFGWGYSSDTKRGIGTNQSFGLAAKLGNGTVANAIGPVGLTFGKNFHSRQGLTSKTIKFGIEEAKKGKNTARYGATSVIPYGTRSSVPMVRMNAYGSTFNSGWNIYAGMKFSAAIIKVGFINKRFNSNTNIVLSNHRIMQPAIGYLHSGKRGAYENQGSAFNTTYPLMDFNRTNDEQYSQEMKNLAFSAQMFDVFRANAMGLGATFRGHRYDVGTYRDPSNVSDDDMNGNNKTIGAIVQLPNKITAELGLAGTEGDGLTQSGNWKMGDGTNVVDFIQEGKGTAFDQAVYFKGVGEHTPDDLTDFNYVGGTEPTYFSLKLESNGKDISQTKKMYGKNGFLASSIEKSTINTYQPAVRAVFYRPYTAAEYETFETTYRSYNGTVFGPSAESSATSIQRKQTLDPNNARAANHLSAVEVVNTDGVKYVFGVPAYEVRSADVSFCATGLTDADLDGVTAYSSGDNTYNNSRGTSNYFDKSEVPAYPHAFLLTEMLSSDYIDRTQNGPSLDDMGNYYKFNYTRLYSESNTYKWRFPMGANTATLDRGLLGTTRDDMGHYSYAEREIWYSHSVETRNLIAEFHLLDRDDAYGVQDENGVIDLTKPLKRLNKIVIYNRSERLGADGANAVPLQTIEFEYTYELCKKLPSNKNTGVDNARSGKLTLRKIRSYTGDSPEKGLFDYEFDYDQSVNKDFTYRTDAWNNYTDPDAARPVDIYPYSEQDQTIANNYSVNWKLQKIRTPSNGILEISYEADSYATVQNRRAMKHLDVVGMTNILDMLDIQASPTWNAAGPGNNIYDEFHQSFNYLSEPNWNILRNYMLQFAQVDQGQVPNNILVFKLDEKIASALSAAAAGEELKKKWFSDPSQVAQQIRELYLRMHVKVKESGSQTELVPMFGTISNDWLTFKAIGVMPKLNSGADYEYGYVMLNPSVVEDNDGKDAGFAFNSLQKSALEFIRRNLPDVVYDACPGCDGDLILDKSVALKKEDINRLMSKKNWVPSIITDFTTVRLYAPKDLKFGGNGRVKQLVYRDNWESMSSEYNSTYTWNFEYPMQQSTSGNAAFEPNTIIDECALYMWDTYVNQVDKYPDETRFTPTPVMSMLYPAPLIGYEKVKLSIAGTANMGYSISEYHTSRTHPITSDMTAIDKSVMTKEPSEVLTGRTTERFGYSQGFVIETNDFHGKPNQSMIYMLDEENNPVLQTRTTYHYAPLTKKQAMLKRDGTISPEYIAQEVDMHADARYIENTFHYKETGASLKLKWFLPNPIPIPFPGLIFSQSSRVQAFYSNAFVKHINRSALVERIETEQLGSINTARNILFDYYSGNTLLASMNDEYNDEIYSFSYPSHWYYKELRELYPSQGVTISTPIAAGGGITGMDQYFTPGDQVKILNLPGQPVAWIAKLNTTTSGALYLMGQGGGASGHVTSAGTYQLQIVRSNRDNRLSETMKEIVTKKDPVNPNGGNPLMVFPTTEIISADVVTYRDRNDFKCGIPNDKEDPNNNNEVELGMPVNPYLFGARADLVIDALYTWQSDRLNAAHPYRTRFDGTYANYTPFYTLNAGLWERYIAPGEPPVTTSGWRRRGEVTRFNEFGNELEAKDELDIYSSVLLGYDRTFSLMPTASALNARQQEIAFDGFEDYNFYGSFSNPIVNNSPHFDFKQTVNGSTVTVDQTQRHSGLGSLKLTGSATATVVSQVGEGCLSSQTYDGRCECIVVQECNCIPPFEPTPGDYIVGAWVKKDNPLGSAQGTIAVTIDSGSPTIMTPSGPVIDGWQRLEGTFTVPSGATTVTVQLRHVSGTSVNFDDVRIHPLLASMVTTVYDPETLLPLAQHDSYNFTTFFNYDENLNLVRLRVETIEGIQTISEMETGGVKRPKP